MRRFHWLLTGCFIYLGLRLSPALGVWLWILLAFVFAGVFFYPSNWLRKSSLGRWQHLLRWKTYMDMGFLCFLVSLTLLRDLLLGPVVLWWTTWRDPVFGPQGSLAVIGLSLLALSFGVWNARSGPRIKSVKIPIDNLPSGLEGYRIVQISDLHIGPTIGEKYVRKVVERVNELAPHMTVLTGDIVDGEVDHHLPSLAPLAKLEPLGRILSVTGNHEYYWDGPRWIREFESVGMQVLQNANVIIRHETHDILVVGVLDPAAALANPSHRPDLDVASRSEKHSAVKILLAHQPNIALEASKKGFDLLLSGHTHAGQFFPFTLLIHSVQEFVRGLKVCGDMWVYVNQGTGYWGPPIRLGTVTEITLLELTLRKRAA